MDIEKESGSKEYYPWVDTLKGLAILLVVIGHLSSPGLLRSWIYVFHMPLFFLVSGFFLIFSKSSLKKFIQKRWNRLMIPYYFNGLLILIPFHGVLYIIGSHYNLTSGESFNWIDHIIGQIIAVRSDWELKGYLWFLPCLLTASILIWCTWKYLFKIRWLIIIGVSLLGILYNKYIGLSLPFSLDMALIAAPIIAGGVDIFKYNSKIQWWFGFMCLGVTIIISRVNGFTDMWASSLGNSYILFYLGGFTGSIFFLKLAQKLVSIKFFIWSGKNSLYIYIYHFILVTFINKIYTILPFNFLREEWFNDIWSIFGAIGIILILKPFSNILKKIIPWSIGYDDHLKRNKRI